MKVLYIGGGFVGACSAAVSADSGHETMVYDIDQHKTALLSSGDRTRIESCLFEKGLGDLLVRNADRITFTSDYADVEAFLDTCEVVFMCVPTPEIDETGESDLSYYNAATEKLSTCLVKRNSGSQSNYIVVVNKSTVPIDTVSRTEQMLAERGVKNVGVVSNPEFLVEGKAVQDSLKPDRIVVGARTERDFEVMRRLYQRFYDSPTVQYLQVSPEEGAASKLLANYYLFNRLAVCFDVIGRTCEAFPGLKFENIRRVLTTDKRIGEWGFYDSLYAGGSCFIKDTRSLAHQLQSVGYDAPLVRETHAANRRQLMSFLNRAEREAQYQWVGKKVALLGVAFKRDTNDVRNSPSSDIVRFLHDKKVGNITVYDPAAMDTFKKTISADLTLHYAQNESEAIHDADVIIVATDWPQFRGVADQLVMQMNSTHTNKPELIMDCRRMFQHRYDDLQKSGCAIIAVGSPLISPQ